MRLIDADKLIKTIEEHDYSLADECGSIDRGMFTIGIMQAIDEQPIAQQWHKLIFRPIPLRKKNFILIGQRLSKTCLILMKRCL